ncbi:DUF4437 domain-containing protein [Tenacibaculum sp. 190524A05c]|uniref:DUF4437 domain-containing protein n=1 Tax=Tenacibaculum platacis TaxID=3137852 RepID=UPI0031FB9EB5
MKSTFIYTLTVIGLFVSCNTKEIDKSKQNEEISDPTNKVLLSSDIVWEKLNPARGDKSPQAGTIWGDRKKSLSPWKKGKNLTGTGFLAKFVDGFSSPPHIHNVTYRAVIIKGLVHNDDPKAENMWMKPGSFWTQPAGESHITSAKGEENIALVEINEGPYLVKPISEAHDNGERPINIDVSNIVWLNNTKTNWIDKNNTAEISFLLNTVNKNGFKSLFVKLPENFNGEIKTTGTVVHAVVIQGNLNYTMPQNKEKKILDTGSYFGSTDKTTHTISNSSNGETILYFRTNGDLYVK